MSMQTFEHQNHNLTISTDECFSYLPEFDGFVISGKKEQGAISCLAPPNLVNFLLNFQALEIVKLKLR